MAEGLLFLVSLAHLLLCSLLSLTEQCTSSAFMIVLLFFLCLCVCLCVCVCVWRGVGGGACVFMWLCVCVVCVFSAWLELFVPQLCNTIGCVETVRQKTLPSVLCCAEQCCACGLLNMYLDHQKRHDT